MAENENVGLNHRFRLEMKGIRMSFTKISGLETSFEFEPYEEGGVNHYRHEFPKIINPGVLVLEMGVGDVKKINRWFNAILSGIFDFKSGTIELINVKNQVIRTWQFEGAYPYKWSGPTLDAKGNEVALEVLELKHQGIREKLS
jgi:phage tail-like protein